MWLSSRRPNAIDLDTLVVEPTNQLVDEHNDDSSEKVPGRKFYSRFITTIQLVLRSGQGNAQGGSLNHYHVKIEGIDPELT